MVSAQDIGSVAVVGPVLWLAGLGWMADFGVGLLLFGLASFVIVGFALIASLVSLGSSYREATRDENNRWKRDILIYPVVGCLAGFLLPWWLGVMTMAHLDEIESDALRIILMILGFYGLFAAPFVSFKLLTVRGNSGEEKFIRFWALPSFFAAVYMWVSLGLWEGWWHSPYVVVSALVL